jgi:ankyrin repeat protein
MTTKSARSASLNTIDTVDSVLTNYSYKPSVKVYNRAQHYTPLFLAVANGHLNSVQVLCSNSSDNIDIDALDSNGNTVYHVCAEMNHFESLRYLLTRKEKKYLEPIYVRNKDENTVLHTACLHGHLEIVKLVMVRIYSGFGTSTESFLQAKNNDGSSCFHLACAKGHFNIVE